jgi:hypothetical protein
VSFILILVLASVWLVTDVDAIGHGRKVVYGTDDGVYISDLREPGRDPVKVLSLLEVSQVDVLEDYQLMIVLSGELFVLSSSGPL